MTGNQEKVSCFFVHPSYYVYLSNLIINKVKKTMIKHLIAVFIGILSIIPIQLHARKYYCEIKGMQKELSSGFKIVFDFGESQVYSI